MKGPPQCLHSLSAVDILELYEKDVITVEEYAKSLLDRIAERDQVVKAWTFLDTDIVLRQARALDALPREQRGPLHGVAIGIKDIMNTRDMPTEFGSPIYKGHRSGLDSSAVGILRAAGAIIVGKTTTTEFTVLNSGPNTTNPRDPNRTPGGSSCGSAAAVGDLHVPISLGAQTGGSIIRPAAYVGVFALKPTFNAISVEGQKAFAPTLDTFGYFARSIEDLQLISDVFNLKDDQITESGLREDTTVALVKTPFWHEAGPGTERAMLKAASVLESQGVKVEWASLPGEAGDREDLARMLKVLTSREAGAAFLREYRVDKAHLHPKISRHVENEANITNAELTKAYDTVARLRPLIDQLAARYSAIITPSAVDEAPIGLDDMGSPAFNTLWTAFHVPVLHLPAFVGDHGMPVGLSIVTGRFRDQHLLGISNFLRAQLTASGGWKEKL